MAKMIRIRWRGVRGGWMDIINEKLKTFFFLKERKENESPKWCGYESSSKHFPFSSIFCLSSFDLVLGLCHLNKFFNFYLTPDRGSPSKTCELLNGYQVLFRTTKRIFLLVKFVAGKFFKKLGERSNSRARGGRWRGAQCRRLLISSSLVSSSRQKICQHLAREISIINLSSSY